MNPEQETPTLVGGIEALVAMRIPQMHTAKAADGKRYRFQAVKLCDWWNRYRAGEQSSRWTEKTLYALEGGGFLVATEHVSQWQGEVSRFEIERYDSDSILDVDQKVLDELRNVIIKETGLKIPLAEIAEDLP